MDKEQAEVYQLLADIAMKLSLVAIGGFILLLFAIVLAVQRNIAYLGDMTEETPFRTPGQLVQSLLDERGWTKVVLAAVLGVSPTIVQRIIGGQRPVDAKVAIALSEVFGEPAERFMELQASYDLARAQIELIPDPGLAARARLYAELPVREMARRGWIEVGDLLNVREVERAVSRFFGKESAGEVVVLPHASKKTAVGEEVTPAQLAWIYRVRQIAGTMIVPPYSTKGMQAAVKKLRDLLASAEEARKVPRILAEAGVRFVVVETLPGAKIDGVCFWLDERSPVIGMTMRHDRIDNFWFVLRHECEHVLRGDGLAGEVLDTELERERAGTGSSIPEQERVANEAASDFCVPTKTLYQFVARKAPIFTERDIVGFAKVVNVHPGLVAGQLQHATERYDRFRNHLVKVRDIVLPNAMHDGWGDVAPSGSTN